MNSLNDREWEIYNIGGSTEYDNILINKDIDNYFNDIINKPVRITNTTTLPKSNYTFDRFYSDYVEHNLLFIVVLVGIVIFLVIRHYVKDFDTFSTDDENKNNTTNTTNDTEKSDKKSNTSNKIKKTNELKKQQIEKLKLIKYKKELEREKQNILTIIDELSNINDYEYRNTKPIEPYLNNEINIGYQNYYSNNPNTNPYTNPHTNPYTNKYSNPTNGNTWIHSNSIPSPMTNFYNQNVNSNIDSTVNSHNQDNNSYANSQYRNITDDQDNKLNEIDGLYIEPPFGN